MTRRLGWGAGAALVAVLLAAAGWGMLHPVGPGGGTLIGRPAPALSLRTFDGRTVSLASLRGTPVVLNFWASWCTPCHVEDPHLQRAARDTGGQVAFMGVNFRDDESAARAYAAAAGDPYPVGRPTTGLDGWGVTAPPHTFFIDAGGTVTASFTGPVDLPILQRYLGLVGVRYPAA